MRALIFQLVGTTPLLLHRISRHQQRNEIASQVKAGKSLEDEALEKMSKDERGNPAVPVSWLWESIRVGCSRVTVEGKQVSFFKLQSVMHLPVGTISLRDTDNHNPTWKVYSSVQHLAPGSKRSIAVVAPMFRDWMLGIQVLVDGKFPDDTLLQKIFAEAGKVGIGLFHPPKKHFGQFRCAIV